MRIAQVAPLCESVPPKYYGGTERIVSYLTEELVAMGHDVGLYASGDSTTKGHLVSVTKESQRMAKELNDPIAAHLLLMERVLKDAPSYDIVHFHLHCWHFPYTRFMQGASYVTTVHSRLDIPDTTNLLRQYPQTPLISISNAQRAPLPNLRWQATVHHGLPKQQLPFQAQEGQYLAFLGRMSPEKGVIRAIAIAKRLGLNLKIAAKVDTPDRAYYENQVRPLIDGTIVEYVGEVNEVEKADFLGNAKALLFPIDWPEPFGLVMLEAMACGTPVIAFGHGSVPEIIEHGSNGFIVQTVAEAIDAVHNLSSVRRSTCRRIFEERFSADRMAENYLQAYRKLVDAKKRPVSTPTNYAV